MVSCVLIDSSLGPVLLVYRVLLVSILSNLLYTLLCWPFLLHNPLLGYAFKVSGFEMIWPAFVFFEALNDSTYSLTPLVMYRLRQRVMSNRFMMILMVFMLLTLFLSLSSLVTVIIVAFCTSPFCRVM